MGKTPILRPETLSDISTVISEPINRIPLQNSPATPDSGQFDDLDFGDYGEDLDYEEFIGNFGKFSADQISPKYVQENLLIDEAIAWDARDAFIESVATKVRKNAEIIRTECQFCAKVHELFSWNFRLY